MNKNRFLRQASCLLVLLLSIQSVYAQKQAAASKRFAGLDTAFARVLKDWKTAGFAVAVVEKNQVVYAKGFGFRDVENKLPVTENTVFAIGSCTKAFTSAIIGLMQKDGLVEYDKPVTSYLPALRFYNNDMNSNVTLRDMMCHRTGVSRYDYSWYFFPTDSRDTLMQRMKAMEPSAPLRQIWQYNNFMFMLQGLVAEKLTGKSWEQNVRDRIVTPLGMSNTTLGLKDWMLAKDLAKGYGLRNDSAINKMDYYDIAGMAPAGSINSSVTDMAKWLRVWINGGRFDGKEILPSPYVREAMSSQMVISGNVPEAKNPENYLSNYGFGWMISSYRGHYRVEHGGNIDGFSASTSFFPTDSIGIVVLVNQNGSSVPSIVRNLIADRVLGLKYKNWESEIHEPYLEGKKKEKDATQREPPKRKAGTKPSHPLTDYAGVYTGPGGEQFEIGMSGDSLIAYVPKQKLLLRHYHYESFQMLDKDDVRDYDSSGQYQKITFTTDENGSVATASLPLEFKPIIFTRADKAKPVSADSLKKYVGDYKLNGTVPVKVYVKGESTLYVFIPGQPEYELVPVDRDKFNLKVLNGYSLKFDTNDKGEVTGLSFVQPNGTFKAVKDIPVMPAVK